MNVRLVFSLVLSGCFLFVSCVKQRPDVNDIEVPPSFSAAVESASTVPFCELIRNAPSHEKQIVRTTALFFRNLENAYLYDVSCSGQNTYVWVELDPAYAYSKNEMKKKFEQIYCSKQPCPTGSALVTVVGRFAGPSGGPYGHLDQYQSRFSIMRVEQVEPNTSRQ
ncbi:MAG: hypothetical protein ACXWID_18690 [Pyrinomonadaceae bacterium]